MIGFRLHDNGQVLLGKNKYRVRRADGKIIIFGRVRFELLEASFDPTLGKELLEKLGVRFREEGFSLIISGGNLRKLIEGLTFRAREFYGRNLIVDYDEIKAVEEVMLSEG